MQAIRITRAGLWRNAYGLWSGYQNLPQTRSHAFAIPVATRFSQRPAFQQAHQSQSLFRRPSNKLKNLCRPVRRDAALSIQQDFVANPRSNLYARGNYIMDEGKQPG